MLCLVVEPLEASCDGGRDGGLKTQILKKNCQLISIRISDSAQKILGNSIMSATSNLQTIEEVGNFVTSLNKRHRPLKAKGLPILHTLHR